MTITPDRITEIVDTINHQFADPRGGYDWAGWFEAQPESDWDRTALAAPGELCLTDGSALVYDPAKHGWAHVSAEDYVLPGDEPAQY